MSTNQTDERIMNLSCKWNSGMITPAEFYGELIEIAHEGGYPDQFWYDLDGNSTGLDKETLNFLRNTVWPMYPVIVQCRGVMGYSELAMHTRDAGKRVYVVFTNIEKTYGYAVLDGGKLLNGSFHQFEDGTIVLS